MAVVDTKKHGKKRKQDPEEDVDDGPFSTAVALEMMSDEEGEDGAVSDDGEIDEFPEIDTRSDSEDEDVEGSEDDIEGLSNEEDYDEDEDDSNDTDDSELHIFPKAKTVISDITGQPKRVYPEIDADYDSDSSTEDACSFFQTSRRLYFNGL